MSRSSVAAALFAVFAFVYPLASQAATLQIDGAGQLLGADDVDVGGVLYDVDFVDGTCAALFGGCDEVGDFTFTTETAATAASNALLTQVFNDGASGNFESVPSLTNGCDEVVSCTVYTPFGIDGTDVDVIGYFHVTGGFEFVTTAAFFDRTLDFASDATAVYAAWELSEAPKIPLPATGWLFLSGLAGLFFVKRRKSAAAA